MAMNKTEKAYVEELLTLKSFNRTVEVLPDVDIPDRYNELTTGFMYVGVRSDSPRVDVACSSSAGHAIGRVDRTQSQRPIKLYSTKLLALKAMRYEVELGMARELRRIDIMIEGETLE